MNSKVKMGNKDLEDQIQESHNEIEKLKGMSNKQPFGPLRSGFRNIRKIMSTKFRDISSHN